LGYQEVVIHRLDPLDLAIITAYLAGITLFGLRFRKSQRTLRDYFLADRNIPWWAIALSIVAAETSTLTIISIPGLAFDSNFAFLQVVFGYVVGRVIISLLFIPQYFRGEMFTAYQLIDRRFGPALHSITAGLFLLTRAAAEGVRVFAVAIVVGIAIGTGDIASIAIVTALTMIYTLEGGMAAVIWTDVVQTAIYVGGTLVAVISIQHAVPGGWPAVHSIAAAAGKFRVLDFSFSVWRPYTFWSGVIGGTFFTTASHGTDQLLVQRLLAARNEGQSKAALISSGIAILVQMTLFLLVGVMLYVYYGTHGGRPAVASDRLFPTYIVEHMPHGIAGLLIAAILAAAMSNLSAALNSLSSTSVIDFYLRRRTGTDDRTRLAISRAITLVWAAILFALALLSRRGGRVVEMGLSIASVAYGALLGVFLLGLLTRRAGQRGAIVGMICGFGVELYVWLATRIPWTWYVVIGSITTFLVGYAASLVIPEPQGSAVHG
jgi:SSS family transporter